jgi:hypothetical protein
LKVKFFVLPLFLAPKLRSVAQNECKKHPYKFFGLKKKESELKKSEKNEKVPKT